MRVLFLTLMLSSAALVPASASALKKAPSWTDCYQLGVNRAVHVEQVGELPEWMDQCLDGRIQMDAAMEPAQHPRPDQVVHSLHHHR
jgi:hypothetical protein